MKRLLRFWVLLGVVIIGAGNLHAICTANFSITGSTCSAINVAFKATDTTKTLKYFWNFGDTASGTGNKDSIASPFHLFSKSGKYTVTLIVNDTNGCKDTFSKTVTIYANPKANYSWTNGCSSSNTSFSDKSTADKGDTISIWKWDFGNSSTSSSQNPQTTYSGVGNYSINLIVISASGCTDTLKKNITIFQKPTGKSDLLQVCKNSQVNFIADSLSAALSYGWDFGDTTFSFSRKSTHVYKRIGYLFPKLTVDFGSTTCKITLDSILVKALPNPAFSILNTSQCFKNNEVCIKLLNNKQKLISRSVDFNDGFVDTVTSLNDSLVCHKYSDTKGGKYLISLRVIDSNSCIASFKAIKPVIIYQEVKADFKVQSPPCENLAVLFKALDAAAGLKYDWNFGDIFSGFDNFDSTINPSHVFSKTGTFTVKLIVSDSNGCRDTFLKTITIFKKPKADYTWTDACSSMNTIYTNTSFADKGDTVISWNWDFGNGKYSNTANTQTSYSGLGNYGVKLIVFSSAGCTDTLRRNLSVFKKPAGRSDVSEICKNSQINFIADTLSKALSYRWDFGDSSFFSVRLASHVYKNPGYFFPLLTVDFGSTKCTIKVDSVLIRNLPDPSFFIVNDTQCFKSNNVCVQLVNKNQKIKLRSVLFDDGFFDDFTPLTDSLVCHKYSNKSGGSYFIMVELVDSNNCIASVSAVNPVIIHPEINAGFSYSGGVGCFKTTINLVNTSNVTPPAVNRFLWDFGDGFIDSAQWTNTKHTYTSNGFFKIALWIKDKYGCEDTYTDTGLVQNTSYIVDANMDSSSGYCKNSNYFHFKQTFITGASIQWAFTPSAGSNNFYTQYSFPLPGLYFPQVRISKNGCDSTLTLDSIVVHGPAVYFGNITNRIQCQIKDTVYFINSSYLFRNKSAVVYWDAGDIFGPNCTTITKDSVNIGQNCRYSRDSLFFKHMYKKGQERCYYTKLIVEDTIVGCRDSAYAAIPLMAPKAKGLFTPSYSVPCPGPEAYKSLGFDLYQSQPTCFKYSWWVMWDSMSARKTGNFDSNWIYNSRIKNYYYDRQSGDSNGYVSIGLIVENGLDTNGKVCRDTGWFHNTIQVTRMTPIFKSNYDASNYYCANSALRFYPLDSNQVSGTRFIWNFGDGQILDTTDQHSVSHVFKRAGKYLVRLWVSSPNGCSGDTSMWIQIGVFKNFSLSTNLKCVRDSLQIFEFNRYYDTISGGRSYWSDSIRMSAGKEQLKYDLGDGIGFQNLGANPKISYNYPGVYAISMAVRDSAGCWDTLSKFRTVNIAGVYADFSLPADSILCSQTLDLKSTSTTIDSTGLPGDFVKTWEWDFGPVYSRSYIPNPRRYFVIGNYNIKLKVSNAFGCKDSITKSLVLIGPKAQFDFLSDTVGCEPLIITFKNKSRNASSYIWQFNDISNGAIGTTKDTNISFRYRGHGNFYPQLIARGLYTKNGISQMCEDIYPDTNLKYNSVVTLWELPKTGFTWVTNCASSTTTFTNTSKISTGSIISEKWFFGDGSSTTSPNPTHKYADTGHYRVVLKIYSDRACEDSLVQTVVVSMTPFANFSFKQSCQGMVSFFNDSTLAFNDKIYLWRWNFGDGSQSNLKNPSILFALDTTYFVRLKVTNVAGCSDSITKPYKVHSNPKPNFTFTNVCDKRNIVFTNSSLSKDSLQAWQWNFGDGTKSGSYSTNHTFGAPAAYNVKLVLKTKWGCKDSTVKTARVYPNPVSKLVINQKAQCFKYHGFLFTDSSRISSGSLTSFWDVGDMSTSAQNPYNYRYAGFGNYSIRLISISGFNCRDTAYDSVKVYAMPIVKFSVNQNNQCVRYNLYNFSDSGRIANGTYTRIWRFGNGDSSIGNPVIYHYKDTGIFNPRLILTSDLGCRDTSTLPVRLWPMPAASFIINDSGQCLTNNTFGFTNTSKIAWGGLNARWEFGDGVINTGTNATHSYAAIGSYTVLLQETSINNCIDTTRKNLLVYPMPKTVFRIDDSLQCLTGNVFKFTNSSSISSGSLTYKWYFGDGTTSVLANPQHSYTTFGTFNVKLVSLSASGCPDSVIQSLIVYPMPQIKPIVNFNYGCINNQKFQFTDSSSIAYGTISRTWKFGDSTTSLAINPKKFFPYAQNYTVWLTEVSNFGCSDSASLAVQVYTKPKVAFTTNDTDQCLFGNSFIFTNKTTISSGSFTQTWRSGDGKSQTTLNASNKYATYGTYKVTLIPVSNFGCTDSVSALMIVHPMPIPAFIVNSNEQCFRLNKFIFTNNSSVATGSLTHKWRFGDTGVSTVTSPGYSYQSVGGFKVSLKSTSNFGCIDSTYDFVLVDPMPVSNFTINDTTQCLNDQNFIVKDVSTILSGTLTRKWAFDDGVFSTLATVNKTFVKDTIHSIKLIQTSDRGCLDSTMKIIEVYSKPIPAFIVNDTDQCMRQNNFIFTNGSSIRKGSLTYQWKFGDLTNSTFASPSHRYFAFGNYTATLTAISENGCLDSLKKRLRVDPMPAVSFSVNDTGQCINNQSFVFTNNSTIPVGSIQHLWKFGDGNTSNLANPVKQFAKDTIYRVLLTETSNKGCVDSVQKIMDVYPKPMVNFAVDDSIQCQFQNAYIFTNKSYIKYGSLSYTWNFGDGNKSNGIGSNHSYSSFGNYKVVLNSISDLGCIDSFKKIITVAAMPKVDFRVNDPGQCFRIQNFVYTNRSTLALGTMTSKWYFGDSDTLRSLNATHVYKSIGSYKPKLIMTTNYGCKDSIQYTVIVNPNARASYTTNDSDQCINRQNYVFTNTSSVNPGQIKGILWSLGNGQTSVQQKASTSYPKSGWYRIILQTTTDSGCVDSFSNRIRVYPKPLAWFDVNDSAQCLYQNDYIFNDLSFDSINITNYNWNINNESQQSTKAANYIFGTPGYKTVTLIASSSRGCYDTSQRQVYVKPMPDPRFEVLKSYYCELTGPYNFTPTTPGGTYFGKNIQFNSYNPVLLWEDTVKYVVTVNGCTDSSMQLTNVYPGPKVDLGKDTTLCKYEVLELFVNSWQSKIKWNDGSTGPYLRVLDPGVYSVIATNICGKETDSIEVSFREINCRFFLPTAFTPNNDGLNDRYKPLIYEVGEMKYQIFDRWGELIYEGNEKDEGWDGTFGEELVPLGNYLVHVTYLYTSSFHYIKITDSGMFILIR